MVDRLETWKPVVGFEGRYEVSDQGRVRSLDRSWQQRSKKGNLYTHTKKGRLLRPGRMSGGHVSVALGRGNSRTAHSLVMEAFRGPAPEGMEVLHKNGCPSDNRLSNLRYGTRSENLRDKKWHGVPVSASSKLRPPQILAIKTKLRSGCPGVVLARAFGVSEATVSAIKVGRLHSDV